MIFRKANSTDEDTIKQIASRAYQKYIERMGKEPAPMRPNIQKNDIVFVCEKENKIIAFAILVIKDGNIFLENLAVEPLHQQKNVGTAFISFIENYLIDCFLILAPWFWLNFLSTQKSNAGKHLAQVNYRIQLIWSNL